MRRDLICAGLLLVLAAIFWTQQDYTEPVDAVLPRFVLLVLAVLGLVLGAAALLRGRGAQQAPAAEATAGAGAAGVAAEGSDSRASATAAPETTTGAGAPRAGAGAVSGADPQDENTDRAPAVDLRILAAAILLLLGWGVAFGLFGITLSGVVAFVATAALVKRGFTTLRDFAVDTGVAIAFVLLCLFVFTRVLYVPLPVSVLLGV